MKKLVALALAVMMTLSLTACGGDPVTLSTKSVNGVSIDVPSDFGGFTDQGSGMLATNEDTSATIIVGIPVDSGGFGPADLDQDSYRQQIFGETDVKFITFDNAADCNGIPAVFANCELTNSNGVDLTVNTWVLFHEDGTTQTVSLTYTTGADTSLEENIDAIVSSVK